MPSVTRSAILSALVGACAPAAVAPPAARPEHVEVSPQAQDAPKVQTGSRPIDAAIARAVAEEAKAPPARAEDQDAWPRRPSSSIAAAPKVEPQLGKKICAGTPGPKERRHRAACCYPDKDLIVRPIRAAFPALRACYDARKKRDAAGRTAFEFRIEQDGSIARVCVSETSTLVDEDAARCMVEVVRKVRYPGMSDAEVDLCGLITLTYPVVFE